MHVFPKNVPDKLDFPFLLKELEHLCVGSLGRQLLYRQSFISDREQLQRQLNFIKEFKEIIAVIIYAYFQKNNGKDNEAENKNAK
jgi:hypothetical protein